MSYNKSGTTVSYQYNADGIRTEKIVNGVKHEYYLNGSQIIREVIYNSAGTYIAKDIRYFYDGEGHPTAIRCFAYASSSSTPTDTTYYLGTNVQGDVTTICDSAGNVLYTYLYDAWGNLIQGKQIATGGNAAAEINPFRYRGYYYDTEINLYYLNSRYYNPQWGRFLNADDSLYVSYLVGINLFVYCCNNPIMYYDPCGQNAAAAFASWSTSGWTFAVADGPFPVGEFVYAIGIIALGTWVVIAGLQKEDNDELPDSLPDESEIDIDMDHVMEEHHPSGSGGPQKDKFPEWMTATMIEEIIRQAYNNASANWPNSLMKPQTAINVVNYYILGITEGQKIHIWLDYLNKIIKTAFPK